MANDDDWLAERFEERRTHLRAVAYRMLGSVPEADDAVRQTWLRLDRAAVDGVQNLTGWMTAAVARVCLGLLRTRIVRGEDPLAVHLPEPTDGHAEDSEQQALLAEAVGLGLLVVLESLTPAERTAFVLHDLFGLPFDEIAATIDRSPAVARQLASRARRCVRSGASVPDPDRHRQREIVDAFFAAARAGDLDALVAVLDRDVVLRSDTGTARARRTVAVHGPEPVAAQVVMVTRLVPFARPALVDGAGGVVVAATPGRALPVLGFTVARGKIFAIDVLGDPQRVEEPSVATAE
ncbi:RNA polymerase sigma-70 factor (ECF subfamily) [Kribbella amoyensis]|uniref:RNA polymerase sigma-70 factor (ECF subfamily) n=1 Tax=Kribbella amoyensis TaxID=996641 RepID=A0A561BS10_9ACTN|nr:sigma factor-like helix-turn-helix DNA-binding protein [Kribbella amoyensis]TWD81690.1 RNA polymerase sigma-70 factor (ECF subfamily) [Kribbella amoyensis]